MIDEDQFGRNENWKYYGRFGNYTSFEDIIKEEYPIIGDVIIDFLNEMNNQRDIYGLDIGCGTGRLAKYIVTKLRDRKIVFDFLDRYQEAIELYRKNVPLENLGEGLRQSWENLDPKRQYDFLMGNNSLGSVNFRNGQNIEKFFSSTTPQGITIITLPSEKGDYVSASKRLWKPIHGREFEKTTIEDLGKIFDERGISYEIKFLTNSIDMAQDPGDERLKIIFSIMMRLGSENIERYNSYFRWFANKIKSKEEQKMDFTYGVIAFGRQSE